MKLDWKVGDRFYFHKNNTESETIKVGYKGVVDVVHDDWVECRCWQFGFDEIKPIIRVVSK